MLLEASPNWVFLKIRETIQEVGFLFPFLAMLKGGPNFEKHPAGLCDFSGLFPTSEGISRVIWGLVFGKPFLM